MDNSKKKTIGIILGVCAFVAVISVTYAFVTKTLTGTKKVTITAGTLSLVLDEKNEITISDALPMYDAVGMIQEEVFNFDLINETSNPTDYTIKLKKVSTGNELAESDVKYYLTKEGVGTPALLSTLTDGVVDTGTIEGTDTIEYSLRLWINEDVTDKNAIAGKSLSYKLAVEASMAEIKGPSFLDTLEEKVDTTSTINFGAISSATNGRGIYKYTEDGEDIYYWRGAVTDNHVIFGGYCWEMVRTTKTGGVKIIYDGTPVEVDGVKTCPNTGSNSQLSSTSAFNSSRNDNAYVGYMYGLTGVTAELSGPQCIKLNSAGTAAEVGTETTKETCEQAGGKWATTAYESTHANVVNSTIKGVIDEWFSTSSLNTEENLEKIEDAVYCNDRRIDTVSGYGNGLGYGTNKTAYMTRNRFYANKTTSIPDLSCSKNDSFTVRDENGNGDLTYPVGLLTADEIVLAGGLFDSNNTDYYLNVGSGNYYWALSPLIFTDSYAYEFFVYPGGRLYYYGVYIPHGVRPVVSLAASTPFASGGDGSETAPYVVE